MADPLTPEDFTPHVNKVFRVNGGVHAFTLARVEQRRRDDAEGERNLREPFNLIFCGPPSPVLREGMYTIEVEGGPSFELYVMPVHTPARDRQDYQASFN
jgi:hypothetical protein